MAWQGTLALCEPLSSWKSQTHFYLISNEQRSSLTGTGLLPSTVQRQFFSTARCFPTKNASLHVTTGARTSLWRHKIQTLELPDCSSGFNPVDNSGKFLSDSCMPQINNMYTSVEVLNKTLLETWDVFGDKILQNLFFSMLN